MVGDKFLGGSEEEKYDRLEDGTGDSLAVAVRFVLCFADEFEVAFCGAEVFFG